MDVRKKLVEQIAKSEDEYPCRSEQDYREFKEYLADHLIAHGVTVQEWISVRERLAEGKVNCIVHYKHSYCDNDDYWAIGICFYDGEKFQMDLSYQVTHWQYLPQPPKGE